MGGCELRIGTVTALDSEKLSVRVRFDDLRDSEGRFMISDWLQVVQRTGTKLDIKPDGEHTHAVTVSDSYTGGGSGSAAEAADHDHQESLTGMWMPKVNDQVLVLYEGVNNGRGYIMGEVMAWR